MSEKLVIIGSGGHARSVIDSALDSGQFEVVGVLSATLSDWEPYRGVAWIGPDSSAKELWDDGCRAAAMGIGFMGGPSCLRSDLFQQYSVIGFSFPAIVDPSATVSEGATVEDGAFIGKGAIVNANASIGKLAIINSAALVEHDCTVGDFSHVAVRAVLCGGVSIGNYVLVGANSTVIQQKTVGDRAVIGAGAVVLGDMPANARALGIFKGRD